MSRALLLAGIAAAGLVAGFGCSVVCADCNCPSGPTSVVGTVTEADRAELVGATVQVTYGAVRVDYTKSDGSAWEAFYTADVGG